MLLLLSAVSVADAFAGISVRSHRLSYLERVPTPYVSSTPQTCMAAAASSAASDDYASIQLIRQDYSTEEDREALIQQLIRPHEEATKRTPRFEEVQTVLRAYLDHHQSTSFVFRYYEDVLGHLQDGAYDKANEGLTEEQWSRLLVGDLQKPFKYLGPEVEDMVTMNTLFYEDGDDWDLSRRKACGLALKALDFVELGFGYGDNEMHP